MGELKMRGRVLVPGIAEGEALVSTESLVWSHGDDPESALIDDVRDSECGERDHQYGNRTDHRCRCGVVRKTVRKNDPGGRSYRSKPDRNDSYRGLDPCQRRRGDDRDHTKKIKDIRMKRKGEEKCKQLSTYV